MNRVLIIDDESALRATWRDALEEDGYEVFDAADGRVGLSVLRGHEIDLVVTDILMPEQEGLETITQIREEFPDIKIIAVSGGGATKNLTFLELAKTFGAARALAKPFRLDELVQAVKVSLSS